MAPDHRLLRTIASIAHQLPTVDEAELSAAFADDLSDTVLINYLATVTKSTAQMSELTEKFALIAPSRASRF